ncbi:MAG: DUF1501 domain-containing protein [Candidatus Saccharimonadales bacterium]
MPNIGLADATQAGRLDQRISLRKRFDRLRREIDQRGEMNALDDFESQAWQMLTGDAARAAFDLTREDLATRERYGLNSWGQQCLMARFHFGKLLTNIHEAGNQNLLLAVSH